MFRMILEGGNYSGKSTIAQALEAEIPHCTVLQMRGFYDPHVLDAFSSAEDLSRYAIKRLSGVLALAQANQFDPTLIVRLQLTDQVYFRLNVQPRFQTSLLPDYSQLEAKLDQLSFRLVLLDADDQTLRDRLQRRITEVRRVVQQRPKGWIRDFDTIKTERDAYRKAFQHSQMLRKLLLDTSGISPDEAAKKIFEWVNR